MAELRLNNVSKRFGETTVLRGVDLAVSDGEFVVFVGPSGCGKSTLLRTIAGLEEASSGEILIDGRRVNEVDAAKRGLAMVFQSYALYPHMSVAENMAFGLKLAKLAKAEIDRRIRDAAGILQIDHLLDRLPKTLSGGQRQRVAIGRAIVREPKIFLFDEPLSNLDAELRVQMRVEIAKLHARLKTTMIYVTHDQVEAMTLADKIVVLRGGSVEQVGTPLDLYNHPANLFVAGFIGSPRMNFLDATISAIGRGHLDIVLPCFGGASLRLAMHGDGLAPGEHLTLGIRPEHLIVDADATGGDAEARLTCKLLLAEQLGSETYLHLLLPDGETLVAQAPGQRASRPGEAVTLGLPAGSCHLFRPTGAAVERNSDASPQGPALRSAMVV